MGSTNRSTAAPSIDPGFRRLFEEHHDALRGYLYRLTAHRSDADDLAQDTWIRAHRGLASFKGRASFRTWLFSIATNLARDHRRVQARWRVDAQDRTREFAESIPGVPLEFQRINRSTPRGVFEVREHIDYCFTCILKTLPLEQQLALLLAEICAFRDAESARITGATLARFKHRLHAARATMQRIFAGRCALVSKQGACYQCSELNAYFNGAHEEQMKKVALAQTELGNDTGGDSAKLLRKRIAVIRSINPIETSGSDLHEAFMRATYSANPPAMRRNSSGDLPA